MADRRKDILTSKLPLNAAVRIMEVRATYSEEVSDAVAAQIWRSLAMLDTILWDDSHRHTVRSSAQLA